MISQNLPLVLLVEDNPGDIFLFEECVRETGQRIELVVCKDVDEAMTALNDNRIPCLALVDLHMPRRDGKYLLAYIREQQHLQGMPVLIFSSSQRQSDHDACRALGACDVLIKPSDWNGYCDLLRVLSRYWTAMVQEDPVSE